MNPFEVLCITVAAGCIYNWCCYPGPLVPGQKSFTFYHWKKCGHCKAMYPEIRRFGSQFKDIKIRWVEERQNNELELNSFPTLIYRGADGHIEKYEGPRSYEAIKSFLEAK